MVVKDSLKLNRFQNVAIPENSTFFARFRGVLPTGSDFSGDENIPDVQSKLGAIIEGMEDFDKQRARE